MKRWRWKQSHMKQVRGREGLDHVGLEESYSARVVCPCEGFFIREWMIGFHDLPFLLLVCSSRSSGQQSRSSTISTKWMGRMALLHQVTEAFILSQMEWRKPPRIQSSSLIALLKPMGYRLVDFPPLYLLYVALLLPPSLHCIFASEHFIGCHQLAPLLPGVLLSSFLPLFHFSFTSTAWLYPWLHPPLLHNAAYPITSLQLSPNLLLTCLMQPVLPATYTSWTFGLPWRWREQVALKDW